MSNIVNRDVEKGIVDDQAAPQPEVVSPESDEHAHYIPDDEPEESESEETTIPTPPQQPEDEKKDPKSQLTQQQQNDPNVVDWDGPTDPANPLNWRTNKKWMGEPEIPN